MVYYIPARKDIISSIIDDKQEVIIRFEDIHSDCESYEWTINNTIYDPIFCDPELCEGQQGIYKLSRYTYFDCQNWRTKMIPLT